MIGKYPLGVTALGMGDTLPNSVMMQASIAISATLSHVKIFTPVAMQATAGLELSANGLIRSLKPIKARIAFVVVGRHGAALPPGGLGADLKIMVDPLHKDIITEQYLLCWFNGHPDHCRVSLKIDDGDTFQPPFVWENPRKTQPALIKIAASIPDDYQNHCLAIAVWQSIGNRNSAASLIRHIAKTRQSIEIQPPDWCHATQIRQGQLIYKFYNGLNNIIGNISDLTRIDWQYEGAVQILAKIPVRNAETGEWRDTTIVVGYANHDETSFYVENLGKRLGWSNGVLLDVRFGVAGFKAKNRGLVCWDSEIVQIREFYPAQQKEIIGDINAQNLSQNNLAILMRSEYLPDLSKPIIVEVINAAINKIKTVVSRGGSVSLENFGEFSAQWAAEKTVFRNGQYVTVPAQRNAVFIPSIGFTKGVNTGLVLTDSAAERLI